MTIRDDQQQQGGDKIVFGKEAAARQGRHVNGHHRHRIVLTVLVGAAGYFVQALTARRGELAAADEAQKLHISEQTRQREHEQMVAQVPPPSRPQPLSLEAPPPLIARRSSSSRSACFS